MGIGGEEEVVCQQTSAGLEIELVAVILLGLMTWGLQGICVKVCRTELCFSKFFSFIGGGCSSDQRCALLLYQKEEAVRIVWVTTTKIWHKNLN